MTKSDQTSEKTYRAIGRFIFEFSQVEYTIRYYLAQEISLDDQRFSAVVESYEIGILCTVATQVFKQSRATQNAKLIKDLIGRFRSLTDKRNRVAHGLWVPFVDGGTVHHVPRTSLTSVPATNQAEELEKLADEACQLRAELERAFTAWTFDL